MLSRLNVAVLALSVIISIAGPASAAVARHGPSGVQAPAAELARVSSGTVLWSRDANVERPIASITKVMTAYLVIKAGHLNREITIPAAVSSYVASHGASSAGLVPGDRLTARQLLYALLIPSGCDAAYVLASAYGGRGGRSAFIARMNATARHLGLGRTRFATFDGLGWPTGYSTYSTPGDLVALGRDAMRLAQFRRIVRLHRYFLRRTRLHHAYLWENTNPLLGSYRGAIGIKTGFIGSAGYCLLFEAVRGRRELIGVVLDDGSAGASGDDAAELLNWGFRRLVRDSRGGGGLGLGGGLQREVACR